MHTHKELVINLKSGYFWSTLHLKNLIIGHDDLTKFIRCSPHSNPIVSFDVFSQVLFFEDSYFPRSQMQCEHNSMAYKESRYN